MEKKRIQVFEEKANYNTLHNNNIILNNKKEGRTGRKLS